GIGEHLGSVHAAGEDAARTNSPAETLFHKGYVYMSNRGTDAIATFALRDEGARLEHMANTPVGAWPRHFTVVRGHREEPDHLVAAAQNGDVLMSLLIHPATGVTTDTGHRPKAPAPVCVLPVPLRRIRRAEAATP